MRILVCGGRNFADPFPYDHSPENAESIRQYRFVHAQLNDIVIQNSKEYNLDDNWLPTDIVIINGKARGVDSASSDYAITNYCQLEEYPAEWKKFGKAAGFVRNVQMLREGKPDLVVAFPGGKGTEMMIRLAREAGVEVREIKYDF